MSSTTKWTANELLSSTASDTLKNTITNLNKAMATANDILAVVEKAVKMVGKFISSPVDMIGTFIKEVSKSFKTIIGDSMSLGGSFIIIHPYNRMNIRKMNIHTEETPVFVPAMTPQEALSEFKASFNNTKDPFRPLWTSNVEVTGTGFLLAFPDPSGLINVMSAFKTLFDVSEFTEIIEEYSKDLNRAKDSANSEGKKLDLDFTIDTMHLVNAEAQIGNKTITYPWLVYDNPLPRLHWYGLSINNIKFLKQLIAKLDESLLLLGGITEDSKEAILDLFDAILKKIKALRALLQALLSLTESIIVSLDSAGVYSFVVDKNYGGVDYVVNSIMDSINNPEDDDAKAVASTLSSTNFSALFFMGASTGVNLDAWESMILDSLTKIRKSIDVSEDSIRYKVIPDLENTMYKEGDTINLSVLSAEVTESNPWYFTYNLYDADYNEISSFTNKDLITGNIAKINSTTFPITLKIPETKKTEGEGEAEPRKTTKFILEVSVFDFVSSMTSTIEFYVTNEFEEMNTDMTDDSGLHGSYDKGKWNYLKFLKSGIAKLVDSLTGRVLEMVSFTESFLLGSTLTSDETNLQLVIDGKIVLKVVNMKGRYILTFNSMEELKAVTMIKIPSFPAAVNFKFGLAIKLRKIGTSLWSIYNIPAYVPIEMGNYEYQVFRNGVWTEILYISVSKASSTNKIC